MSFCPLSIGDPEAAGDSLEKSVLDKTESAQPTPCQSERKMNPADQGIGQHGDPDLDQNRVSRSAPECLDLQVLLDPLEEQLDLPTLLVELSDRPRRKIAAIGQEDEDLARLGIPEADPSKGSVPIDMGTCPGQGDLLVGGNAACASRNPAAFQDPVLHTSLQARNEEHISIVEVGKERSVYVSAVHRDDRARGDVQGLGNGEIMGGTVADEDQLGKCDIGTHQGVDLDGRAIRRDQSPIKEFDAECYAGRVQTVADSLQSPGLPTRDAMAGFKNLRHQGAEELVAAGSVGIGEGGTGDALDSETATQLGQVLPEGDQVAEAGGTAQVSKQQGEEVVASTEGAGAVITSKVLDRILDHGVRDFPDDLGEECGILGHGLRLLPLEVAGFLYNSVLPRKPRDSNHFLFSDRFIRATHFVHFGYHGSPGQCANRTPMGYRYIEMDKISFNDAVTEVVDSLVG